MAILGIEGGASCSKAILRLENKSEIQLQFGPANYTLLTPAGLQEFLEGVRREIKDRTEGERSQTSTLNGPGLGTGSGAIVIGKVAIGLPGILRESDKTAVAAAATTVWPSVTQVWVGSDIQIALSCLEQNCDSLNSSPNLCHEYEFNKKCIIICGTGSVCFGKASKLRSSTHEDVANVLADVEIVHKVGGNGHIVGDRGSGYSIGLQALRQSMRKFDRTGSSPTLLIAVMKFLKLNGINELVTWSINASKTEVASLAKIVTQYWLDFKDETATAIIMNAVEDLSLDFKALIKKLTTKSGDGQSGNSILIGLTGSLLTECPQFAQLLSDAIKSDLNAKENRVNVEIRVVTDTVRGALTFIAENYNKPEKLEKQNPELEPEPVSNKNWSVNDMENELRALILPKLTDLPTTELRNPNSMNLDKLTELEGIELMLNEDGKINTEILKEKDKIAKLIEKITEAFKKGGRLFYVGAGTSGRLGILDASECPPTFKAPPHWVQGIIAGGTQAVFQAVEGAEDSVVGGILAIQGKTLTSRDIVLGIAASGRTPFVWGAVYEAKKSGAFTALLTFNPNLEVKLESGLDMLLTINVGPEILTGSTRLKCGTATKSVLNMLTTLSMVKYGKCLENLMIDVMASNEKLKDRAARIVLIILHNELPELTKERATEVLQSHQFDIKKTVAYLRSK